MHPWITGNEKDEIPMNNNHKFSKAIVNFELDDKLRRLLNFVTFLAIAKNHEQVKAKILLERIEKNKLIRQT